MNTKIPDDIFLTNLDDIINWDREKIIGASFFGVSCCFSEIISSVNPRFKLNQFNTKTLSVSPDKANLLIISGTPFKKMGATILSLYDQMPDPKWVVAMGDCAHSGGMYDVYSVIQGINQILPVDLTIPGCPPRPEALLEGLKQLQEKIDGEDRQAGADAVSAQAHVSDHQTPRPAEENSGDASARQQLKRTYPNGAKLTAEQIHERFEGRVIVDPDSVDIPGFIATAADIPVLLKYLKRGTRVKYARLEDITVVDERLRRIRPAHDFTLVYHLLSLQVPGYIRIKVPLKGDSPEAPSVTSVWPSANWYEREIYDMFGIRFSGHPDLRRLLMPPEWDGFPLRKDHVSRATDMAPFTADTARALMPLPISWYFAGKRIEAPDETFILNYGSIHPGIHGVLRLNARHHDGKIVELDPDIGYQHRGAEKIGERLSWSQYIPYTDRIDYLSGVQNNLAYLHSVETLLGVEVPPRAESIRIVLCELFRIANHLIWLGTFAHNVGVRAPVATVFKSRETILDIVEMITGGRIHPAWFCIGGVADDLPEGWVQVVEKFIHDFGNQLNAFEKTLSDDPIFRSRTEGLGVISSQDAVDWGVSGPNLRATGIPWDLRRAMSYSGYDRFDFDVVIAEGGDCFARYQVRIGEMRESLKIIRQAVITMPGGRWITEDDHDHHEAVDATVYSNLETMAPKGECYRTIESSKGGYGYYAVSDGGNIPYRMRIRTPSFPHLQALQKMAKDSSLADLTLILGSIDVLLADIDR